MARAGRLVGAPPLVLAGAAALVWAVPGATPWLELERASTQGGEPWRLLTGHFTHWNLAHLAWDGVVFAALGMQCWQVSRALFWRCLLGGALAISAAVLICQPEIQSYRGLSGIDAAFFAALSVDTLRAARRAGRRGPLLAVAAAAALFAAKLIYELATATAFFVDLGPGVVPLPLAHLVGAAVGGLAAFGLGRHARRGPGRAIAGTSRAVVHTPRSAGEIDEPYRDRPQLDRRIWRESNPITGSTR